MSLQYDVVRLEDDREGLTIERQMKLLGERAKQGWELITVVADVSINREFSGESNSIDGLWFYFKKS